MTALSTPLTAYTLVDLIALVKPRVTALVIGTTAAGLFIAPGAPRPTLVFFTLLGTVLMVAAANTLNMYLERDIDALMLRTQNRPLPAKRLSPQVALWLGIELAVLAAIILSAAVNQLTAVLGIAAFIAYVFYYTPLKQKTTWALLIGAIPGAMPPLMGWTAATGSLDLPGFNLFAILFLWQVPHFLAIALFRKEDYQKAGLKILPLEKGEAATKHAMVRYLGALLPVSLAPVLLHGAGTVYFVTAAILGTVFLGWGCYGLKRDAGVRWAKSFFLVSIVYLPIVLLVLVLDPL